MDMNQIKRQILTILSSNENRTFYDKFLDIERLLSKLPISKVILNYQFPYTNSFLNISQDDNGHTLIKLILDDKTEYKFGLQLSVRELMSQGEQIIKVIEQHKLSFIKGMSNEFKEEIKKVTEGQILSFQNSTSYVCIKKDGDKLLFKRTFEGTLETATIDDFRDSDTISVNLNNDLDLQYLYGKAYNYKSNTVELVRNINDSDGHFIVTDIEKKLGLNDVANLCIGKIHLTLMQKNGLYQWYDSNGEKLDRELVARIFGWAKNTTFNVDIKEFRSNKNYLENGFNDTLLNDIQIKYIEQAKALISINDFRGLTEKAFDYSKKIGEKTTLNLNGLIEDENHNFDAVTFAFIVQNGQKQIYQITYEDNDFTNFVKKAETIIFEQFEEICKQKVNRYYQLMKNTYAERIQDKLLDKTIEEREKILDNLVKTTIEKNQKENKGYNALDVNKENFDNLSKKAEVLINAFLENYQKETVNIKDFDNYREL